MEPEPETLPPTEPEPETLPPTEPEPETLPPTEPEPETLPPTEPETETLPPTEPEPVPVPPVITLESLLSSQEALVAKEQTDKNNLLTISNPDLNDIHAKLLVWASKGFPEAYTILSFFLEAPAHCSDGVTRSLDDYITFCSGKTLYDHLAVLQGFLVGMTIGFTYSRNILAVVVSRCL